MPTNVQVPTLGESVTEAVLLRWLKNDGQYVAADEPVAELETDKANVDLPAPSAGILRANKKPGDTVKVGEAVARIEEAPAPQETTKAQPAPAANQPAAAPAVSKTSAAAQHQNTGSTASQDLRPSVRRLVEENRLSPDALSATGPGGRLIKEDVLRYLEKQKGGPADNGAAPPSAPAKQAPAAATESPPPASQSSADFDANGIKRVPLSKIRKRIAERLVAAQHTAAILTTFNEIDLSAVMSLRAQYKERFAERYGVPLGLMSFFAQGVVLALREFARVNAFLDGNDIVYHNYVNLGIAVSTERGLTVPVLKNVQDMSFARIESEIKRVATAARDGKLGIEELSGATFTITNGGVYGSLLSTPILSPPESGILGMHAIKERPVAVNGKVEIRPMMFVALSYDHRLVDGRESVSFLVRLKESLEDPARLMLEI